MAKDFKTGGRQKGTPNKYTQELKDTYQDFLNKNIGKMQSLFDDVAATNPQKALELMIKISEFVLPKMKAIELDTPVNDDQELVINIVHTTSNAN